MSVAELGGQAGFRVFVFVHLDVSINGPDEQSIITYVSQFLEHFPGLEEVGLPLDSEKNSFAAADRFLSALVVLSARRAHPDDGEERLPVPTQLPRHRLRPQKEWCSGEPGKGAVLKVPEGLWTSPAQNTDLLSVTRWQLQAMSRQASGVALLVHRRLQN